MDIVNEVIGPICALFCVFGLLFLFSCYLKSKLPKLERQNEILRKMLVEKEIENEILQIKCNDLANQIIDKKTE